MTSSPYSGFSRQDLIDRLGALLEEQHDLQKRLDELYIEIAVISSTIELEAH